MTRCARRTSAHNCIRYQTEGCPRAPFRFFGTFLDRARPILYNAVENHRTIEVYYEKVSFRISGAVPVTRAADRLRNRRPDRQNGDGRRLDLCQELQRGLFRADRCAESDRRSRQVAQHVRRYLRRPGGRRQGRRRGHVLLRHECAGRGCR